MSEIKTVGPTLHRDPEVNRRLWMALADSNLPTTLKPTDLCRRAKVGTASEPSGDDGYDVRSLTSTSSAIGTPALRLLFRHSLVWQLSAGKPYTVTEKGRAVFARVRSGDLKP